MGYLLYAGDPAEGVILGMGSRGGGKDSSSSYLGELRGVCWALEDTKKLVQGTPLVLWTDNESVYQGIT